MTKFKDYILNEQKSDKAKIAFDDLSGLEIDFNNGGYITLNISKKDLQKMIDMPGISVKTNADINF